MALGAAIVGFDKFFGLSTGWMRFIVTQLSLERVLQEFHYDWAFLLAQRQEQQVKTNIPLLQRARDFTLKVEDLVKQETDAWVQEFQSDIAELAVHATIHESKIGAKLGDTFLGMCTLINPLDWSQNSTVILQAASRADLPN